MERKSGVLLAVSSLPSKHGIGCFGKEAFEFIDLLKDGGFSIWQILPLNPLGYGHSPYQPFSSFAIDDLYIDLDLLSEEGLIERVPPIHQELPKILYEEIKQYKNHFLYQAYLNDIKRNGSTLDEFMSKNPWVKDYAGFMTLKKKNNMVSWDNWPKEDQDWIDNKSSFDGMLEEQYLYEIWLQMTAYKQWDSVHKYANLKGIKIMGDIPFYVGYDSLDVWANKKCFLLDKDNRPSWIAGVPPDYFSETGQRWGNPIYDWEYLNNTNFEFLIDRIVKNSKLYDAIRLDHFRAFDTFWKIPSSCPTAIEGEWIEAPGYKFFDILLNEYQNIEIIAEDLGLLREEVYTLRDHYKFPGMNVIQFTFNDAEINKSVDWNQENQVAYIGTHDNDTFMSFFNQLSEDDQTTWNTTLKELGFNHGTINEKVLTYIYSLKSNWVIIDMQDILSLNEEGRMNVPGVIDDKNWTWKLTSFNDFKDKISHLKTLNKKYKRL